MRVAYLIAGAGGMYCGSCLRDNRLAGALRAAGRDISVIPLYTPLRTDETDASDRPVHYGGVSVYLAHRWPALRRLPRWMLRALDHPTVLRLATGRAVETDAAKLGPLTLDMLDSRGTVHRDHRDRLVELLRQIEPDVIHLPNLLFGGLAAPLKRALQRPVVCTLAGEDVFIDGMSRTHQDRAHALIRAADAHIAAYISPTRYYASRMHEQYGFAEGRVHHVPMGVMLAGAERSEHDSPRFTIGYLARVAPEKGLLQLVEVLAALRAAGHDAVVRAAGTCTAPRYLKAVQARVREAGLADRFTYVGELDLAGKSEFLSTIDCLCVPAVHPEPKGLYVLEALACGVPVVLPRAGAFVELVESTGGGVLVEPPTAPRLAEALAALAGDRDRGRTLGAEGRAGVESAYTTTHMADAAWAVFERAARASAPAPS